MKSKGILPESKPYTWTPLEYYNHLESVLDIVGEYKGARFLIKKCKHWREGILFRAKISGPFSDGSIAEYLENVDTAILKFIQLDQLPELELKDVTA